MTRSWHLITGEYPPQPGGVSDYSCSIAIALAAAGDSVHVWAPACGEEPARDPSSVVVHRLAGGFTLRGLRALSRGLDALPAPRTLLVQYVPHAFGLRGMNVPFAAWLAARRGDRVVLVMHEVTVPWGSRRRMKQSVLSAVQRTMAAIAVHSADRVYVSVPAWDGVLRGFVPAMPATEWLPVPSNVPDHADADRVATARAHANPERGVLIGHFGTFGGMITELLGPVLRSLLAREDGRCAVLIGRGGREFAEALARRAPELAGRIVATGGLAAEEIAAYARACDVLVQPYPDGVTSRRGTTMAGLALGVPVVTNDGALTESIWRESGAVALAARPDAAEITHAVEAVLADRDALERLGRRGADVYSQWFSVLRVVERLRAGEEVGV